MEDGVEADLSRSRHRLSCTRAQPRLGSCTRDCINPFVTSDDPIGDPPGHPGHWGNLLALSTVWAEAPH